MFCSGNAAHMDTMVTNQADSSYFVNGAPKDCQISASNQVVGVYCAEQKYLFFHKKDEFFNGDLSTQKVENLKPEYGIAKVHKGSGDFFVTSTFSDDSNWAVTQVVDGEIKTVHWKAYGLTPLNFAFDDLLFLDYGIYASTGKYYWGVGYLDMDRIMVNFRETTEVKGLDIKFKEDGFFGILWSTHYIESTGSYQLYRRDINPLFYIFNNVTYTSIGDNCGTVVESSTDIVAVACPSSTDPTSSFITILKVDGLTVIHTQTSTSNTFFIGGFIQISNFTNHHQVFYSSMKSSTGAQGQISMVEIFQDKHNSSDFKTHLTEEVFSDDTYNSFGKYFSISSSGSTNKIYISSSLSSSSNSVAHEFEVASICSHQQVYASSTKLCLAVSSGSVALGLQTSSPTTCASIDDSVDYNRFIGESICNFGCSSGQFGKNCQSCSAYMARVGQAAPSGYSWDDTAADQCKLKSSTTGLAHCTEFKRCSECISSEQCEYSNYQCKSTAQSLGTSPGSIYDKCYSEGTKEHPIKFCGQSVIDMRTFSSSYNVMPTNSKMPRGILCRYKLTLNESISDSFTIEADSSVTIKMQMVKNGIPSDVNPTSRRNLGQDGRNLALASSTFSVSDADSVNVLFMTNSDLDDPTISMASSKNYYDSGVSTPSPSPIVDNSPSAVGRTDAKSSNSKKNIGIILGVCLSVFVLAVILVVSLVCFLRIRKRKRSSDTTVEGSEQVEVSGTSSEIPPLEVRKKLDMCKEEQYACKVDAFSIGNCIVCLKDFQDEAKVRVISECNHMFHSDCLKQVLLSSYKGDKAYKCPLCNIRI
ncbi:unnamed protein product [Moneuplotes crassus]|uniref:RING-type domain-containing protein n=1 Tax=Euplotes crassus TaxID=5936 RepID=A0AAD2D8K0_EUPCR|nr:unnamed protein product [Moneuplotes crassus]